MSVGLDLFTLTFDSSPIKGEGNMSVGLDLFTLTFDSSPIKGEGNMSVGLDLFTLTFDSSPIKGEGICGWFGLLFSRTLPLWIDESLITLCQRVRFQRKGVNAL